MGETVRRGFGSRRWGAGFVRGSSTRSLSCRRSWPSASGAVGSTFATGPRRGLELDEVRPFTIPRRWNVVIWVVSGVVRVRIRNRAHPGYRALGLRRVDVRAGGALTAGNVLIEQCVAIASGQLRRRLMKPWLTGRKHRLEALQPELAAVRRAHADEPEAR